MTFRVCLSVYKTDNAVYLVCGNPSIERNRYRLQPVCNIHDETSAERLRLLDHHDV